MKLQDLKPAVGSKMRTKRIGRGPGSGMGKTSTRGHKGQWARSGGGVRIGFEGGQMPLSRRLPKRGFCNIWGDTFSVINVSDLERFENGTVITAELLKQEGVISKIEKNGLKVLGRGELTKALTVQAAKVSAGAKEIIEKAQGSVEVIG